jgi:hypothetical protein
MPLATEWFRGTISQDGEPVAEDVEVYLEVEQEGRLKRFSGYIITGLNWRKLRPGEDYLLTLEDGHSGHIFFADAVPFGDGTPRAIQISFAEGFGSAD